MLETINDRVSVVMYFNARQRRAEPYLVSWRGRDYKVGKIGFHHCIFKGDTRHHIYELVDKAESLWMRLRLDTSNLHWTLEAVSDGEPD